MIRRDRNVAEACRVGAKRRPARPVAGRWTRPFKTFLARTTAAEPPRPGAAKPPRREG